jgi:hypothetical protein
MGGGSALAHAAHALAHAQAHAAFAHSGHHAAHEHAVGFAATSPQPLLLAPLPEDGALVLREPPPGGSGSVRVLVNPLAGLHVAAAAGAPTVPLHLLPPPPPPPPSHLLPPLPPHSMPPAAGS